MSSVTNAWSRDIARFTMANPIRANPDVIRQATLDNMSVDDFLHLARSWGFENFEIVPYGTWDDDDYYDQRFGDDDEWYATNMSVAVKDGVVKMCEWGMELDPGFPCCK